MNKKALKAQMICRSQAIEANDYVRRSIYGETSPKAATEVVLHVLERVNYWLGHPLVGPEQCVRDWEEPLKAIFDALVALRQYLQGRVDPESMALARELGEIFEELKTIQQKAGIVQVSVGERKYWH
jgi:hypothetical protein